MTKGNVIRIPHKTVKNVLADTLASADNYETVICIVIDNDGEVRVGWSEQSQADLAYSLVKFTQVMNEQIT